MTKAEIVEKIADRTGLETGAVLECVESFMAVVKLTMSQGENIYLRGFGTFMIKQRAAKKGRNVSKGETINIPEHNIPAFKPCPEFKKLVH